LVRLNDGRGRAGPPPGASMLENDSIHAHRQSQRKRENVNGN